MVAEKYFVPDIAKRWTHSGKEKTTNFKWNVPFRIRQGLRSAPIMSFLTQVWHSCYSAAITIGKETNRQV